jgi:hypothetical protein
MHEWADRLGWLVIGAVWCLVLDNLFGHHLTSVVVFVAVVLSGGFTIVWSFREARVLRVMQRRLLWLLDREADATHYEGEMADDRRRQTEE